MRRYIRGAGLISKFWKKYINPLYGSKMLICFYLQILLPNSQNLKSFS